MIINFVAYNSIQIIIDMQNMNDISTKYANNFKKLIMVISLFSLITLCIPTPLINNKIINSSDEDLMPSVPGYVQQNSPRVFSGYLLTKTNKQLHYILVQSKNGAENNDSLTLYLAGGPGCSSKIAFLSQFAPFYLPPQVQYKDLDQKLQLNPYSWHNISNLLFIDSPVGTGYSPSDQSYLYNDQNVAQDNFNALLYFFTQKFPNFKTKSFYIAGQSYAGKFIPDLVVRINNYNLNTQTKIKLNGIMIGNGVMDYSDDRNQISSINYIFTRNMIDPMLDKNWENSCQIDPASAGCQFFFKRYDELLYEINFRSIYGKCYKKLKNDIQQEHEMHKFRKMYNIDQQGLSSYQDKKTQFFNTIKKCQPHYNIQQYWNKQDILNAFRSTKVRKFTACNQQIFKIYNRNMAGSMLQYAKIIAQTNVRILFYAGDWDDTVPYTNIIYNLQRLGMKQNGGVQHWINTKTNQHVGFKRLFVKDTKQVKLWIVKGVGHEVARDKRDVAYELFKSFINNLS